MSGTGTRLPLDGILVVACEQAVAAPLATRQLAELGARVIKVERPEVGDFARAYDETVNGQSSHFVWLNRSKESLALDLKDSASLDILLTLIDRADVFVQNFAPGAAARLGLGAAELRKRNPRLITCSVSGYGSSGPYRDAKAYDLLIQSEAGLISVTGNEDAPAKAGIPAADIGAGMYAFSGILAALYDREKTGIGVDLEISLFDSLIEWMGYPMYYTEYGGTAPARTGASHAAIAPYGAFTAGDGHEVVLAIQNDREWISFCQSVLRQSGLVDDPRFETGALRVSNRKALHEEIDGVFSTLTIEAVEERLKNGRIAYARRRTVPEVIEHPQLLARHRRAQVDSPAGPISAILPVIGFPGRPARMDPIPSVGQHNELIMSWLKEGEESSR